MESGGKPPLHPTLRLAHSAARAHAERTRAPHKRSRRRPPGRQRRATAGAYLPRHGDDEHLGRKIFFKLASLEKGEAATGPNRESKSRGRDGFKQRVNKGRDLRDAHAPAL